ncbi:MAG: RluA family pseudouridine synthase [Bdellovibrio sp.]|nr:RluA family pseudouridine synthase [Bdellovibrio sp.]
MIAFDDGVNHFNNKEFNLLSEILYEHLTLNSKNFEDLLKLGAIYVNNERQVKDKFIAENSSFRVHTKPRRYNCAYPWSSLIIFENDFFLVLNKPSGVPSHPSVDNAVEDALTQVSLARKFPLFVTHRLDTLTSGLIVYGKKQSFVKDFNMQMQHRNVRKKYVALIESTQNLPSKLTHYMDPGPGTPKKLSDQVTKDWPLCELEILDQKQVSPKLSWVKLNLLTGRTHQIRSQLSHLHAPVSGDLLYGAKSAFQPNAIALRSCEIEFRHNDKRMKFNISEEFSLS